MKTQFKKGVLEFCVLLLINKNEFYGYQIMKKIINEFKNTSESTVYAILRRLLSDEYISCYSKDCDSNIPRKYYKITQKGIEYLTQSIDEWNDMCDCVTRIIK